jgi:hypothetical protein
MSKTTAAMSAALASMVVFTAPAARGAEDLVSFTGSWGIVSQSQVTSYSVSNEAFSFSFDLPSPIANQTINDSGFLLYATTQATNFVYNLNGSPIALILSQVAFWTTSEGGFFDLDFADGGSINFTGGPGVLGVLDSPLTLQTGTFSIPTIGINGGIVETPGFGGAGTLTITSAPEPASFALLGTALIGLRAVRRRVCA